MSETNERIIIYQLLPRLFGNLNTTNKPGGTYAENGAGKMSYFTPARLREIRKRGFTHIWFTGMLNHATQTDRSAQGLPADCADVVKGRAGSPYAVRDYYDICADLADNVPNRMAEFEALVARTHAAGLKMVFDFVPNHVARSYHSLCKPDGVRDLGEDDDRSQFFSPNNNFYYIPGERLHLDNIGHADSAYVEEPAKATGNDVFHAWPGRNDWYETVKLNYGVVDGRLCDAPKPLSTWKKMADILLFWAAKGIDAFRCDMAEMVPVEFWNYAIGRTKSQFPNVQFIAEVYNPALYRRYIHEGGFDYLYDKVGLYDTLRDVVCGRRSAADITHCWQAVDDIAPHMLHFLENHDEQRIASDFFAADGLRAVPAAVVAASMGTQPFMLYAGQEYGERGMDAEGFSGRDGRTTIFDYWCPEFCQKRAKGRRALTADEKRLFDFYTRLLTLQNRQPALREGSFFDLTYANAHHPSLYVFLRHTKKQTVLCLANFADEPLRASINIPQHAFDCLRLRAGKRKAVELLTDATVNCQLSTVNCFSTEIPAHGAQLIAF